MIVQYKTPPDYSWNSRLDRMFKLREAKRMFPEEKSVEVQLTLYNKTLPLGERIPLRVSTTTHGMKSPTYNEIVNMPMCPKCEKAELTIKRLPLNKDGFLSQLYCTNPECDLILNSEYPVEHWLYEIRKENERGSK